MSHLIPSAPPQAVCIRCRRLTWDTNDLGTEDRMTQPDGSPCGGKFVPVTSTGTLTLTFTNPEAAAYLETGLPEAEEPPVPGLQEPDGGRRGD